MRRITIFTVLMISAALLTACATGPGAGNLVTPEPSETPLPAPTETPIPPTPIDEGEMLPEAARAARQALADMLKIDTSEIVISEISEQEFSDSCLGLGGPHESCLQVMTPGFVVEMSVAGTDYIYHASTDGSVVRLAEPAAIRASLQALSALLGIGTNEITINQVTATEFRDGCLEVAEPGVMCTDVMTPGFVIDLTAAGTRYVYHTNTDGTVVKLAETGASTGLPVDGADPLVRLASEFLAKQLGVPVEAVSLVSKEAVDWSDACLGIIEPGVGCATVITPGYRVVLENNGTQYVLRTNLDGSKIVLEKPDQD